MYCLDIALFSYIPFFTRPLYKNGEKTKGKQKSSFNASGSHSLLLFKRVILRKAMCKGDSLIFGKKKLNQTKQSKRCLPNKCPKTRRKPTNQTNKKQPKKPNKNPKQTNHKNHSRKLA